MSTVLRTHNPSVVSSNLTRPTTLTCKDGSDQRLTVTAGVADTVANERQDVGNWTDDVSVLGDWE